MIVRLTVDIAPSLEEDMIDCLLGFVQLTSFSSYEIRRHGDGEMLSTLEKVTGRALAIRFDLLLDESFVETLLGEIKKSVGIGSPYSVMSLQEHGVL